MRVLSRVVLATALLAQPLTPVLARYRHHHPYHHTYHSHGFSSGYDTTGYYTAVSGHQVHRPMHANSRPSGATARCGDGSWSFSESHRGTCSHHGGVSSWL